MAETNDAYAMAQQQLAIVAEKINLALSTAQQRHNHNVIFLKSKVSIAHEIHLLSYR